MPAARLENHVLLNIYLILLENKSMINTTYLQVDNTINNITDNHAKILKSEFNIMIQNKDKTLPKLHKICIDFQSFIKYHT